MLNKYQRRGGVGDNDDFGSLCYVYSEQGIKDNLGVCKSGWYMEIEREILLDELTLKDK